MDTLPWWAWKRRRTRLRFLERVALTEIRISHGPTPCLATSFESAYLMGRYGGGADHAAGLAFLDIAKMTNQETGQDLTVSLRMPMDVAL